MFASAAPASAAVFEGDVSPMGPVILFNWSSPTYSSADLSSRYAFNGTFSAVGDFYVTVTRHAYTPIAGGGWNDAVSTANYFATSSTLGAYLLDAVKPLGDPAAYATASMTISGVFQGFTPVHYRLSIDAVPEPASWAMMIAGFGLAGAALRGRRRPANLQPHFG